VPKKLKIFLFLSKFIQRHYKNTQPNRLKLTIVSTESSTSIYLRLPVGDLKQKDKNQWYNLILVFIILII